MDGIHDMGGLAGFGPVEKDEAVFHADWERRVFGMALASRGARNADVFRHAIERIDPASYLTVGYYGRWLAGLERVVEEGIQASPEPGARRAVDRAPAFAIGDRVRTRTVPVAGHTRLPRYARGQTGSIVRVQGAWVLPDTNAHGRGEHPEHVYSVGFDAVELWGETAEPGTRVHLDLFESYLTRAGDGA